MRRRTIAPHRTWGGGCVSSAPGGSPMIVCGTMEGSVSASSDHPRCATAGRSGISAMCGTARASHTFIRKVRSIEPRIHGLSPLCGRLPSVDAQIVVRLPAADALMVALPLVAFHLQVIRRIVGAKGLGEHRVPFQVVEGFTQRGGQKANATLP